MSDTATADTKAFETLRAQAALRGIQVREVSPAEYLVSMRGMYRMAEGLDDLRSVLIRMGVSAAKS